MECRIAGHIGGTARKSRRQARRREDGNIVCYCCAEPGHLWPNCSKNQQQGQVPPQWQGNAGHEPGQLIGIVGAGEPQIPGGTATHSEDRHWSHGDACCFVWGEASVSGHRHRSSVVGLFT